MLFECLEALKNWRLVTFTSHSRWIIRKIRTNAGVASPDGEGAPPVIRCRIWDIRRLFSRTRSCFSVSIVAISFSFAASWPTNSSCLFFRFVRSLPSASGSPECWPDSLLEVGRIYFWSWMVVSRSAIVSSASSFLTISLPSKSFWVSNSY